MQKTIKNTLHNSLNKNKDQNLNQYGLKIYLLLINISALFFSKTKLNIDLIKIGFFCDSIKNGGVERVMSLLINYLSKEKRFSLYLITKKGKQEGEYYIPPNTQRISLNIKGISLIEAIKSNHIDILIYNLFYRKEIENLNKLKTTKIVYYNHLSFLFWIYQNKKHLNNTVYYVYRKCRYVISLIPLENDYLFKKWGINSILMDNPTTYEYDSIIPSDLTKKNIIMIGRANDYIKRYELGIYAMKYIIKEIPECQMNIISFPVTKYEILISKLNLEKNVKFLGYQKNIEKYLKNSSLHILSSLSEGYPMVLSETKIFGIPSIICGLDYLALAKGGTVIIYDDNPNTIAKEAIKILNDDVYRKKLGKQARKSMKKVKNQIIIKKWIKIILSVYHSKKSTYFTKFDSNKSITKKEAEKILNNQLILLQKRKPDLKHLTIEKLKIFSLI